MMDEDEDNSIRVFSTHLGPKSLKQLEVGQTFHPFPRLPAELRHKIWHYANTEPRLVDMRGGAKHYRGHMSKGKQWTVDWKIFGPATLYVNHEARLRGTSLFKEISAPKILRRLTYFNRFDDVLYLHNDIQALEFHQNVTSTPRLQYPRRRKEQDIESVRYLACALNPLDVSKSSYLYSHPKLKLCSPLTYLFLSISRRCYIG